MKEVTSNKGIIKAVLSGGTVSDRKNPVIICVVGRSGCGKSTFIREKIGTDFIRIDAGLLFYEVGGENQSEFPGSLMNDLNEVGGRIAQKSIEGRFDIVTEFTGADTVRMQMLMRALSDISYTVEIKYIKVDLNQVSIWNTQREDGLISAQDTDEFHFQWLVNAVNTWSGDEQSEILDGSTSDAIRTPRNLVSSIFSGFHGPPKEIRSDGQARKIAGRFLEFASVDKSLIRDAGTLPVARKLVCRAFEMLLESAKVNGETGNSKTGRNSESDPDLSDQYRSVFEYQELDMHDRKLVLELGNEVTDREISIQLTRDDLTHSQEEDLDLIRLNRRRLVEKYRMRSEADYAERAALSAAGSKSDSIAAPK